MKKSTISLIISFVAFLISLTVMAYNYGLSTGLEQFHRCNETSQEKNKIIQEYEQLIRSY